MVPTLLISGSSAALLPPTTNLTRREKVEMTFNKKYVFLSIHSINSDY